MTGPRWELGKLRMVTLNWFYNQKIAKSHASSSIITVIWSNRSCLMKAKKLCPKPFPSRNKSCAAMKEASTEQEYYRQTSLTPRLTLKITSTSSNMAVMMRPSRLYSSILRKEWFKRIISKKTLSLPCVETTFAGLTQARQRYPHWKSAC